MLRAEPLYREPYDGHIGECEYGEYRRDQRALRRLLDSGPEDEVAQIEQETDEHGGQARIPGPPDSPDDARPDGARHQVDGGERERHFGDGDSQRIVLEVLCREIKHTGDQGHEESGERREGRRDVEIDDAVDGSLLGVVGDLQQDGVEIPDEQQSRQDSENVDSRLTHELVSTRAPNPVLTNNQQPTTN